jgi:hypothetical protein
VRETTSADSAYFVLMALTFISLYVFPVLLVVYAVLAVQRWRRARRERGDPP